MNVLYALILGLVQGLTEFLPISSSAHLKIFKSFLPIPYALFDLACHIGTALALLLYFRSDIRHLFREPKRMVPFIIALCPLVPAYFCLKPVRDLLSNPIFLGPLLFVTAGLLFASKKKLNGGGQAVRAKDALWIGAMQSFALVPGISRSASTITAGLFRGLSVREAVRFSFLLSIPAVLGGAVLEGMKVWRGGFVLGDEMAVCGIGLVTSAFVGFLAIRWALPFLEKGRFRPFAWYCLIVATLLSIGTLW